VAGAGQVSNLALQTATVNIRPEFWDHRYEWRIDPANTPYTANCKDELERMNRYLANPPVVMDPFILELERVIKEHDKIMYELEAMQAKIPDAMKSLNEYAAMLPVETQVHFKVIIDALEGHAVPIDDK
jgi:hypothetical protein